MQPANVTTHHVRTHTRKLMMPNDLHSVVAAFEQDHGRTWAVIGIDKRDAHTGNVDGHVERHR